MDIDNKMLAELAEQLGFKDNDQRKRKKAPDLAEQYKDKSDEELIAEIRNIKKMTKDNQAQFEKQLKAIKALRVMMNDQQKARLDMIIRLLESDDD
ncbi:MAG: hypothetical protein ACOX5F_08175 [Anaerovoracaceae bacterium]|jgi:hypothetical protein